jgi:hypothetical protein
MGVAGVSEFRRFNAAVEAAKLKVPIAEAFPLLKAAKAHERPAEGHVPGKIVLRNREPCAPTRQRHLIFGVSQSRGSRATAVRPRRRVAQRNQKLMIAKLMIVMAAGDARGKVSSVLGQSGCGRAG